MIDRVGYKNKRVCTLACSVLGLCSLYFFGSQVIDFRWFVGFLVRVADAKIVNICANVHIESGTWILCSKAYTIWNQVNIMRENITLAQTEYEYEKDRMTEYMLAK